MSKLVEEWRPIKDYEGYYEVSDWGRIRTVEREVPFGNQKRIIKERILKGALDAWWYHQVGLSKNSKQSTKKVHQLVAKAFIENPEGKTDIDHIDCDKTNNRVENLRWVTCKENMNNPKTRKMLSEAQKNTLYKHERDEFGKWKKQNPVN